MSTSEARDEFARIIQAITDYSGEMSCETWEKTYPEFVGMTEDDLYRQLTLRKAKLLLGRKSHQHRKVNDVKRMA